MEINQARLLELTKWEQERSAELSSSNSYFDQGSIEWDLFDALFRIALQDRVEQKRLPVSLLLRLGREIGLPTLRWVLQQVGASQSDTVYQIEVKRRLDKDWTNGNLQKQSATNRGIIEFGNRTLEAIYLRKASRSDARAHAATLCNMNKDERTLERYYRDFKALCKMKGYVPSALHHLGARPQFFLDQL